MRSQAFTQFRVSPMAHQTIHCLLCALWAFWTDLHGIAPNTYVQFCQRLKALMPETPPDGGDMTIYMQDVVTWVQNTMPIVRYPCRDQQPTT